MKKSETPPSPLTDSNYRRLYSEEIDNHDKLPETALQQELVDLTAELIEIPSTHSKRDEIDRCADFIHHWLSSHSIPHRRMHHQGVPSIIVLPREGKIPVLLMSHFDVVETINPALFRPWVEDGRLFGRGAIDDKYAVALSLILYREHLKRISRDGGSKSDICFGLLLTGDEEIGGKNGAAKACEAIQTDFFIALDGGGPDLIVNKEKGIIRLQLEAHGKSAHAARPWLGDSAFDLMVSDYRKLSELFSRSTEDRWHKTMVLSNLTVGNGSINMVPEKALASLDIRYTENDDPEEILGDIKKAVQSKVLVLESAPVFSSLPSKYIDLLLAHSGGAILGFEHGASDACHLANRGIPGVIWGADGEMSHHTEHEHIVLASLYRLYHNLDNYLLDVSTRTAKN
ncbi:M20 family metallopeptidase [Desulforhopalus singaporensis]|uniref:Succinyl-diaminopimelate desuccinylase n=1 Tax=Desulforhopalus singaporensis TaxID=91360 RepID=A0A1H0T9H0_9BACT|nr:M20 family metallopeptidase [Desulforhopalus singaporensis]SDP50146.1 succinyl-diaminopimelate desuccinylase [Desulforhopalus singaporensis]